MLLFDARATLGSLSAIITALPRNGERGIADGIRYDQGLNFYGGVEMKPFTLEWWLSILAYYLGHLGGLSSQKAINEYYRSHPERKVIEKIIWVKRRIIDKYGEQND